ERGWNKVWLESVTLAANRPKIRKQYKKASMMTRALRERHVKQMLEELGIKNAGVAAPGVVTFLEAISTKLVLDRLVGINAGHKELLDILARVRDRLQDRSSLELSEIL